MALTRLAHQLVREHFRDKATRLAVDATLGNGHDCKFLVELGFDRIIGFDIQQQAIEQTERQFTSSVKNLELIKNSHHNMQTYLKGSVDCFMFNLGYLPGGNHSLTTQSRTSVLALECAIKNLSDNGFISLLVYPGHEEGKLETQAVANAVDNVKHLKVSKHRSKSENETAPILYTLS